MFTCSFTLLLLLVWDFSHNIPLVAPTRRHETDRRYKEAGHNMQRVN
jgi:hypothetical protein